MKKNLQLKIVSILVLLITSTLSAQSFTDGNFNYDVISGSDVQLTGYITAPTGSLTIPTTVTDGSLFYTVTSIFESAFYGCSGLTSLIIPNSVTSIQDSAFRNCTGLTSLSIGNSVTRIDNYAFYSCTGLTSVDVSWSTPLVIGNVFPGVTLSGVTLNVSAPGVPGDYAAAPVWQSFGTITLGTNSYQSNSNIKVYPNPANSYVTISGLVDTVNYSVYNVLGAEIRTGSTTSDQKIDIQNLSKGTYFIKLENKNTIKFIKD
jgi:hypothetical protein